MTVVIINKHTVDNYSLRDSVGHISITRKGDVHMSKSLAEELGVLTRGVILKKQENGDEWLVCSTGGDDGIKFTIYNDGRVRYRGKELAKALKDNGWEPGMRIDFGSDLIDGIWFLEIGRRKLKPRGKDARKIS